MILNRLRLHCSLCRKENSSFRRVMMQTVTLRSKRYFLPCHKRALFCRRLKKFLHRLKHLSPRKDVKNLGRLHKKCLRFFPFCFQKELLLQTFPNCLKAGQTSFEKQARIQFLLKDLQTEKHSHWKELPILFR